MTIALTDFKIGSATLMAALSDSVIGTPVLDMSATEVSQLSFQIRDHGYALLASGLLSATTTISLGAERYSISALELEDNFVISITSRSSGIQKLKKAKDVGIVKGVSPSEYIRLRGEAVGLTVKTEPSAVRPQIAKTKRQGEESESDWDVMRRLANELGYYLFEARGTLYFGRPSWLIANTANRWTGLIFTSTPGFRRSLDDPESPVTVSFALDPAQAALIRPGDVVAVTGYPTFNGDYMVVGVPVTINDLTTPVTISAMTPEDPEPQPDVGSGAGSGVNPLFGAPSFADLGTPNLYGEHQGASQNWGWPVKQGRVFRRFGDSIFNPDAGKKMQTSYGIYIALTTNSPIYAAHAGTVSRVGEALVIDWAPPYARGSTPASVRSVYYNVRAATPSSVSRGEIIGYVRSPSSGTPYLYFEVHSQGVRVDPMQWMPTSSPPDIPIGPLLNAGTPPTVPPIPPARVGGPTA